MAAECFAAYADTSITFPVNISLQLLSTFLQLPSPVSLQVLSILLVAKAMPPRRPRTHAPAAADGAAKREPSTAGLVDGADGHGAAAAGAAPSARARVRAGVCFSANLCAKPGPFAARPLDGNGGHAVNARQALLLCWACMSKVLRVSYSPTHMPFACVTIQCTHAPGKIGKVLMNRILFFCGRCRGGRGDSAHSEWSGEARRGGCGAG